MTALQEPDEKVRAFAAGAVDYITKPAYPPEVLARVAAHLQIRQLQRSLADELALRIDAEEQLSHSLDRAIVLTEAGKVSEGSAENLFMLRGGRLVTPGLNDDILEGITRAGIIEIAGELGIPVAERQIDRSELYVADEIFLVGTGAQVSPVIEVDHRAVGTGKIGTITRKIQDRYFAAVRGKLPQYRHWVTPIY